MPKKLTRSREILDAYQFDANRTDSVGLTPPVVAGKNLSGRILRKPTPLGASGSGVK